MSSINPRSYTHRLRRYVTYRTSKVRPEYFSDLAAKVLAKQPQQKMTGPEVVYNGLKMLSAAMVAKLGPAPPGMTEFYHDIPMRDGYMSSLKIHKPFQAPAGPLIVLCFGGGFVGGDNDQLSDTARALVNMFGATVVNINYRLAPKYEFPASQYDAWDSMKWIAENATGPELSADPTKGFIMGGASAGACLTAVLSRQFQDQKLAYPLTGQWLNVPPCLDLGSCPDKYKSYFISPEQNAAAPTLSKEALAMLREVTKWDTTSELWCASRAKTPISGQPRTYFQVSRTTYTPLLRPLKIEGFDSGHLLTDFAASDRWYGSAQR